MAHSCAQEPHPGQLSYFCPACPQPDINLPPDWEEDNKDKWKYQCSFVMDSNFSPEQMKQRGSEDDIHLTVDSGYFTGAGRYQCHLEVANDTREVCVVAP